MRAARRIIVKGLVQGVGFRPFIHRLAGEFSLSGWVDNRHDSVHIHLEGSIADIESFMQQLPIRKPPASAIHSIDFRDAELNPYSDFSIVQSKEGSERMEITEVSPDIAVCEECLQDMKSQPHRLDYPFVNCTNCGPRFTIISDLPYDRSATTMSVFQMCPTCGAEYADLSDRRYHAQPLACLHCGPNYELHKEGKTLKGTDAIIAEISGILGHHGIIAIKGLGGYNLMCDATDPIAVTRLREFKNRESKPFAVMFASVLALTRYCLPDAREIDLLKSWQRPIVILESKGILADEVSNGFPTVGAMLPYMPFHHLLFERIGQDALVMTSGNIAEEPIITGDEDSRQVFGKQLDAIVSYDREIHNRTDDSVIRVIDEKPCIIRRSRGYAPSPVRLNRNVDAIFAAGAELSNCFAIGKGNQAILSQHIGDLKNLETLQFYEETYARFSRLFRFEPRMAAVDLHPDYLSTRFAASLGIEQVQVQHHHAHIASCMAEHNLEEPIIGVAFDGTGLGPDGTVWGSEFMVCDYSSFVRHAHFEYIPLPGGDVVVNHPWRTALSYLHKHFQADALPLFQSLGACRRISSKEMEMVHAGIVKGINTLPGCSAGRLFDAVAAITGVCISPGFHAEAPMRLEAIASRSEAAPYPFDPGNSIGFAPMFTEIIRDLRIGTGPDLISRRFHETIAQAVVLTVRNISRESGVRKVVLTGGVFQNRLLSESILKLLRSDGLAVFTQSKVPAGDGGIALGQLLVAAASTS